MIVLYLVSTLQRSGPIVQLLNIIENCSMEECEVHVVTLSPEADDSLWDRFKALGVKLRSLGLSRVDGLLVGKSKVRGLLESIGPDVIHTHGLRADSILSSLKVDVPWVMTSHNFPYEDYPMKFGRLKGWLMVRQHLSAMRRCKHLVACSKTILHKLNGVGVQGTAIQNGVRISDKEVIPASLMSEVPRPMYVSVGSLIPRKNMQLIVESFNSLPEEGRGSLVILGDGPQMADLRDKAGSNVYFTGNVGNVPDYLAGADYFVSSSLSEGLPNTVLEALASGLPVILSDIESHQEIATECPRACTIFSLKDGVEALSKALATAPDNFGETVSQEAMRIASTVFSAEGMSARYQALYQEIVEAK